jgi:DNA-binding NtrC family response regulator
MSQSPHIIVIDYNADSRFLLVKTLSRRFPSATIYECDDADKAVEITRGMSLSAIVTHRTFDTPGVELVQQLREADPNVPIIMVSGVNRESDAIAAGATSFLHYDEWLRIGAVVEANLRTPVWPMPSSSLA